ncbi:MAG: hypothetical protein JO286_12360 [Solirubrobacterales bacterium]|nr:hypothetical protein [Solirubrobacterales bacterium]MBV9367408.1 hypothetical protein [Solirubrobacterales bacterium]MBV9807973.1 hypothetical protein [Solirubrobacterales bacterium]
MFRPDANLPMRLGRTVLIPFGPLIVVIALASSRELTESVAGPLLLIAMAWFFCSLILVPALLFRADAPPGSSTDEDGGGSGGPQEPPSRDPGPGGIPLPDAEQSSERVRDHVRRKRRWPRRTAREPVPASSPKVLR